MKQHSRKYISDTNELIYKILFVGDIGTGKTSIIKKYVHDTFSAGYKSTIGVDFAMKTLTRTNYDVKLLLWDIAGQERFTNMTRIYYKDAHAAIIVFDIIRVHTFTSITNWLDDIRIKLGDDLPVYVFANKCDIYNDFEESDLAEYCKQKNIHGYFKTSALNGTGISTALDSLVDLIMEKNNVNVGVKTDSDLIDINLEDRYYSNPSTTNGCCK